MGGTSGVFYTQFGITMAVAVGISAVNALTLSPALCALILRPNEILVEGKKPEFSYPLPHGIRIIVPTNCPKYKNGVKFLIKRKWLAWSAFAAAVGLSVLLHEYHQDQLGPFGRYRFYFRQYRYTRRQYPG